MRFGKGFNMAGLAVAALMLAAMLSLSACRSMFEAEYTYSSLYGAGDQLEENQEIDIKSYTQLVETLQSMVSGYQKHGILRFSNYSGSVSDDLADACREVRTSVPIGAYAVSDLSYELERIVSYHTAEVSITYKKTRGEVNSVVTLNGTAELETAVTGAMAEGCEKLTVRIYSSVVDEAYIREMISEAYFDQQLSVAPQPNPEVKSYPSEGFNRIYEISFGWNETEERLGEMRKQLSSEVKSICRAEVYADETETALGLAEALARVCPESDDAKNDTAYGALVEHEAGSLGIAMAYKALCSAKGIDCIVVRGSIIETKLSEHAWNIVKLDGKHYHIDVSRLNAESGQTAFPAGDTAMWGSYVWETEFYPACGGAIGSYTLD